MSALVDVLALMAKHTINGGFPTGLLCSLVQIDGGQVRGENGRWRYPPRPSPRVMLRELRKLEAAGAVVCLGHRYDVFPKDCWRGNAATNAELIWKPTDAARVSP